MQDSKLNREMLCFRLGNLSLLIGIVLFISCRYVYFFETCDDALIKDLASGRYSGAPEAFNMQTLFLLGKFFQLLYLHFPQIEWFPLFLLACQYGSILLISDRLIIIFEKWWVRIICLLTFYTTVLAFFGGRLIIVQYTVTAAMLGGTACFLFITSRLPYKEKIAGSANVKDTLKRSIWPLILVFGAVNLRPKMMLLLVPFAGLAIIIAGLFSHHKFGSGVFKATIFVLISMLLTVAIPECIDRMAFSGKETREFIEYFDSRTDLYDFSRVYLYDEAEEFYTTIEMPRERYKLLERKNFGLDDTITKETFNIVSQFYTNNVKKETSGFAKLKETLAAYRHRFDTKKDRPYSLIIGVAYITIVFMSFLLITKKEWYLGICSLLCFVVEMAGKSLLWLFLLWRDRYPERISDSMGYAEVVLVIGFLILLSAQLKKEKGQSKAYKAICNLVPLSFAIWLLVITTYTLPFQVRGYMEVVKDEINDNEPYFELLDYFEANPDDFFWIDTISVMNYREPLFFGENSFKNYDSMGNWITSSPEYIKKLDKMGFSDMLSSFTEKNVYFVIEKEEKPDWLSEFFEYKDIDVSIEKIRNVADTFDVYKLSKSN